MSWTIWGRNQLVIKQFKFYPNGACLSRAFERGTGLFSFRFFCYIFSHFYKLSVRRVEFAKPINQRYECLLAEYAFGIPHDSAKSTLNTRPVFSGCQFKEYYPFFGYV